MGEGLKLAFWTLGTTLLKYFVRNETLLQFLRLPLARQKALLESLVQKNKQSLSLNASPEPLYNNWTYRWQGIRRYFQLPCSQGTRSARVDWIQKRLPKDARIAVLGDDDYVSVELSRRNFSFVEVADCDGKLMHSIQQLTKNHKFPPRCFQGDFRNAKFLNHRSADLICIDPPYNIQWASLFIEQALRTAGNQKDVTIMLMINQKCFPDIELERIHHLMFDAGFVLESVEESFNSYPLQGLSQFFLKLAVWLTTDLKPGRFLEFRSDLLVYARGNAIHLRDDLSLVSADI